MESSEIIERIFSKANEYGFDSLSDTERTIYVIANVDFEINLGGVFGYMSNSSKKELPYLESAFKEIGANLVSKVASEFAAVAHLCDKNDEFIILANKLEDSIQNQIDYGQLLDEYIEKMA